jgi:hypothetical protein
MTRKTKQEIKEEALQVFSDFPENFVDLIARTNPDLIYHVCVFMYICMYICMYVYIYSHLYMFIYVYMYMYMYM